MKVIIINATMREETSYNIAHVLAELIAGEHGVIFEVFLPANLPDFCCGCSLCIYKGEQECPNAKNVAAIESAMEESQVIIFASPVYGHHIPASLKNFFDHFYFRWIYHRPGSGMWNKQGVIITSHAFGTVRHAQKDIRHNLENWGVSSIHKMSFKTDRRRWEEVRPYDKFKIGKRLEKLVRQVLKKMDSRPVIKARLLFYKGFIFQKYLNKNTLDTDYWGEKGWLDVIRPWDIRMLRK